MSGSTREEDASTWACEAIALSNVADIVNVREGKVEHSDLDKARHGGGDDLGHEHGTRRHLHIVAKLEISNEAKCLRPLQQLVSIDL